MKKRSRKTVRRIKINAAPKPIFHELSGSLVDDRKPILQAILFKFAEARLRMEAAR